MRAVRRRRPQSSQARVHLAVGVLVGGLLGSTAGLMIGVKQYVQTNDAVITEPEARYAADQPQLSAGGGPDPADDNCASDPRVAWPLLGMLAGTILGVTAARATNRAPALRGSGRSRRLARRLSKESAR